MNDNTNIIRPSTLCIFKSISSHMSSSNRCQWYRNSTVYTRKTQSEYEFAWKYRYMKAMLFKTMMFDGGLLQIEMFGNVSKYLIKLIVKGDRKMNCCQSPINSIVLRFMDFESDLSRILRDIIITLHNSADWFVLELKSLQGEKWADLITISANYTFDAWTIIKKLLELGN